MRKRVGPYEQLHVEVEMAPIRRYLRITKHSILEVRIYLDRPADADAWLLKRSDPALPRVIQAIRPLVLPKLREENERGKGKAGAKAKKKGVKDVVVEGETRSSFLGTITCTIIESQKLLRGSPHVASSFLEDSMQTADCDRRL